WSPTGKPVVPKNRTHLRQGFGGSSSGERNPPKPIRSIADRVRIHSYAFLHGQGRGLLRRRMNNYQKTIPAGIPNQNKSVYPDPVDHCPDLLTAPGRKVYN
ncbi:MAG: hypothetical protein H6Q55_3209, partial [Deltaproteobacteria bacterium]|nr:hypothetical protein [Deltaproteobacteria bacterium]